MSKHYIQDCLQVCADWGLIPTEFRQCMTWEEQVLWLTKFLKEKVIPEFNGLSEQVNTLQTWFDNLDVQEEINNKLDEMAESGELADIIAQYLELAGVLAYDTIAAMAEAENLSAGSTARVLGNSSMAAGDGAYYKIREILNTDVPDGFNLVALTNDPTLVAERITDGNLNSAVSTLNARIDNIVNQKWVFVGDSYAEGYNPDGNVTGWTTLLKTAMGLDSDTCTILQAGGAGFANPSNKYETMIGNATADNAVTDVLICGGYNDLTYSESDIFNGMSATKTAILAKYPNVKNIYIGFIGGCANEYHGDIHIRVSYYANSCNTLGLTYMPNLEYALFNVGYLGSDKIHPNSYGQNAITKAIYSALHGGFTYTGFYDLTIDTTQSMHFPSVDWKLHLYSVNNISYLASYDGAKFLTANSDFSFTPGDLIKLGKITQTGIIGTKYYANAEFLIGNVIVQSYSTPSGYYNMLGKIIIDKDGIVWLKFEQTVNDAHDNYQGFGAIHQIQIPTFTIIYPTDTL